MGRTIPRLPLNSPEMPNPENIKPHKFKKGQSGNPKGRKPGSINARTVIKRWLEAEEKKKNPISEKEEVLSQLDLITLAQLVKARKGDTSAFNALLDRTEGKATQPIAGVDEQGEVKPISITLNLNQ
jgi:hypothetical protein